MNVNQKNIRIGYILSYYFPQYVRTKTLLKSLKNIEDIEVYEAINHNISPLRYIETILKLLWIRIVYSPDCYVLGFRGYEIFWLVRLITLRKILILDHMMSPYDSLLNEYKKIKKGDFVQKMIYEYERAMLKNADLILTDTSLHQQYFANFFQIPIEKIHAVPVGADESLFYEHISKDIGTKTDNFSILFYGSFLPLHGIDIILDAANFLRGTNVYFTLIGGSRFDLSHFHKKIADLHLTNIRHIPWVDYQDLPDWISKADLCLGGPFGNTGQSQRVVTGKTFQCIAMGKPTIVGHIKQDCGFRDKFNALLVNQGDSQDLANAIYWALNNRHKLREIGERGKELFHENYSTKCITVQLAKIIKNELLSA